MGRTCLALGCGAPERSRSLCSRHYTRARVAGLLSPRALGGCAAHGCGEPRWCRGWCRRHYDQARAHGRPAPEREHRPAGARCAVAGCRARPCTRGMCQTHYDRWWRVAGWRVVMKVKRRRA